MTGSSQIAKIVLSNAVVRIVGLGDEYPDDSPRSRNNSQNPANANVSACGGSMGLHGLNSLNLVLGMVCLDYYSTEHSWLKRINILEGSWGCERQHEGLSLRKTSRVEEG